nr:putative PHD zinc finger protein [Ipomoea batatas]
MRQPENQENGMITSHHHAALFAFTYCQNRREETAVGLRWLRLVTAYDPPSPTVAKKPIRRRTWKAIYDCCLLVAIDERDGREASAEEEGCPATVRRPRHLALCRPSPVTATAIRRRPIPVKGKLVLILRRSVQLRKANRTGKGREQEKNDNQPPPRCSVRSPTAKIGRERDCRWSSLVEARYRYDPPSPTVGRNQTPEDWKAIYIVACWLPSTRETEERLARRGRERLSATVRDHRHSVVPPSPVTSNRDTPASIPVKGRASAMANRTEAKEVDKSDNDKQSDSLVNCSGGVEKERKLNGDRCY